MTMVRLSLILVVVCLALASVGECQDVGWQTVDWCTRYVTVTKTATRSVAYSCGSLSRRRTCYRQQTNVVTEIKSEKFCCVGIEKNGVCQISVTTTTTPTTTTKTPTTTTTTPTTTTTRITTTTTTTATTRPDSKCGVRLNSGSYIVGGTNANHGQFPWMASVLVNGEHICGGTIINRYWILTSASCIVNSNTQVRVGEHNRVLNDGSEVTLPATLLGIHGSYNSSLHINDIAMIKVQSPIVYNQYVQPICLPNAGESVPLGVNLTIAGWGTTIKGPRTSASVSATILQKATVQAYDLNYCASWYGSTKVTSNTMCVRDGKGDYEISGCFGDGGGPIMITANSVTTQLGIMSFLSGTGCAMGRPVVYTRVSSYIDWINFVMNNY